MIISIRSASLVELKLSWLGSPQIELRGKPIKLEMRKVTALLAYLSLRHGEVSRESLAAMFWPENDQQHAMGSLRRALWSLSSRLNFASLDIDREMVGLGERSLIRVDTEELHQRIAQVRLHHPHGQEEIPCSDCIAVLEEVVCLYRGDFLEGFNLKDCPEFDDWQTSQRENLRSELAQALNWLVLGNEVHRSWEKAIQCARRWVLLDRLEETAQRALIRVLFQAGQRSAAIRQYESFARLLEDELGQAPEVETTRLLKDIQAGEGQERLSGKPTSPPIAQEPATEPLIETKLIIPPSRADLVTRPRLNALLDSGSLRSLTLISAPAGFGKTTLLASWASRSGRPIAWFSIDEGDNDPFRFIAYLIAALDTVLPGISEHFRGFLQALQPSVQPLLVRLLNRLASTDKSIVLILDDYQFIHSPDVHKAVSFLLDKIPPCLHLVLATRADPALPLARLRARDQLVELRAADLRFTVEESGGFLKRIMSLDLDRQDILALDARTEGWVAGLQLAALAIRTMLASQSVGPDGKSGHQDISRFIQAFSGSHRYILDYLGEEVLASRSEDTRRFLLQTSILERLCAPLCDAILERQGSQAIFEELENENLFLIPLDNERRWYRYHHLFAELLRFKFEEAFSRGPQAIHEQLNGVDELHLRAADWFEKNGLLSEAVQHVLAAKAFEQAAGMVEAQANTMLFNTGQVYPLFGWLAALPPQLFRTRPRLNIIKAWTMISHNQFASAAELVDAAWQAAQDQPAQQVDSIAGEIALVRGVLAQLSTREVEVTRAQALLAWEKLPPDDLVLRGLAAWMLGVSYYWDGDPRTAEKYFLQGIPLCREARNIYFLLGAIADLCGVYREQGKNRQAYQLLVQTQQEFTSCGCQPHPILGHLFINASQILLQWNRLEEAEHYLQQGIDMVSQDITGEILIFGISVLPYLKLAQGKREEALHLAEECLSRIETYPLPYVPRLVKANLVRFWISVGDQERVESWLSTCGLSPDDPIPYKEEPEYIALARGLIWGGQAGEALKILQKLYAAAQSSGRDGKLFNVLALQALAFQQIKNAGRAFEALENSLSLAAPEGYIRTFVDEGRPMEDLLTMGSARGLWRKNHLEGYVNRLLDAIHQDQALLEGTVQPADAGDGCQCQSETSSPVGLIEPLSQRELEVLKLAAGGFSNSQIGQALNLTVGTVKTHLHHIFGKLGVEGRGQAIALARELRLW
jgi:LuxR family maltose regulon positive regulatory protein